LGDGDRAGDLGRIYTFRYVGQDVAGNDAACVTHVVVPHDGS
jgi:hypothetical protein